MEHDRKLIFRRASLDDRDLLFAWANDAETRRNSFSVKPISYNEHVAWLQKKLSSPDTLLLIASVNLGAEQDTNNEKPKGHTDIGILRLDKEETRLIISYSVAPDYRGRGLGYLLLRDGIAFEVKNRILSADILHPVFYADVKPDNKASVKIFNKLGFSLAKSNETAMHFVLPLSASL